MDTELEPVYSNNPSTSDMLPFSNFSSVFAYKAALVSYQEIMHLPRCSDTEYEDDELRVDHKGLI